MAAYWSSCSLIPSQVPGQRLAYMFNKLPYKYEPGVTRSQRHASIISASIHEEKEVKPVTPSSPQKTIAPPSAVFIPTSTPMVKSWSWPVIPIPRCPMCLCPGSSPLICTTASGKTGSRIMFPPMDPLMQLSFSSGFKPVKPVSPLF